MAGDVISVIKLRRTFLRQHKNNFVNEMDFAF
jgi:hypothetical protein